MFGSPLVDARCRHSNARRLGIAAIRAASGELDLIHVDLFDRLQALGSRLTPARAAVLVAGIDRLRNDLRFNVNRTLIAETILAGVAGAPLPPH